ncbi:Hypothetical predicted protein [Mytilus galloprovincialis]|uniref:Reverse transcriptase domain-containing protein n=1 Tax=Mytilus galloprovincialis TaxID=29158 RepID=A0A8B6CYM1_MYTGA|nr:Hypothetical predicted protein [Mytilus galloprovincialis]
MQSPFQTAPLVEHATGLMRGEFVMELVDTPISAVSVSKVILSPHATRIKQQTDQMRMDRPEILKTQLTYNDLQLLQPNLNKCKLPTPIKTDRLKFHLQGYDSEKTLYLLNGFKNGFRLEHNGPRSQFNCSNLKSAKSNPLIVQEKINKEVNCQRVMGPYLEKPFLNLRVSPLGLVPKKSKSAWRLIHHLSYPDKKSNSVNAGISDESAAVHYAGIHEAINEIKQLRSHKYQVFLSKTDVRSAFRILPVNPSDYELLGFKWNNKFYYDCCLPMGCRTSCKIFEEFSTALEWIALTKLGITSMVHILDDFLIIEKSKEDAISKLKAFVNLCEDLGVPLSAEKTELPSQVMDFVGITLDVIKQEARLPPDKITKCRHLLEKFSHMKRCTLKELQSLIGVLNFACSVIQPGRAFLRRMINLTMTVSDGQNHVYLNQETKDDIRIWLQFLDSFNGKSMFLNESFMSSNTLELHTDAAQSKGYAGIYGSKWFYGPFPENWKNINIMTLEFYPIILAIELWGTLWRNHSILLFTDNEALVSVINKQSTSDGPAMQMVRYMVFRCLQFNILFKAKHIPGKKNIFADCLSRLQVEQFLRISPAAQPKPCLVPHQFQPQNFWSTLQS